MFYLQTVASIDLSIGYGDYRHASLRQNQSPSPEQTLKKYYISTYAS